MPQINHRHRIELVLPNVIGYERIAMACSASFGQMSGIAPDRIEDLKTIVAEAATNAIAHGNDNRPDARVVIRLELLPDALKVTVTDEGSGFENTIKDPDIERIIEELDEPIGFGLFLIRNLADEVAYSRIPEGGHRVEMRIAL
jgi:serine/threonine-protein kinase RsbW